MANENSFATLNDLKSSTTTINIANELPDGEILNDTNIEAAIKSALSKSSSIYIPAGIYHFNYHERIKNRKIEIIFDNDCVISPGRGSADTDYRAVDKGTDTSTSGGNRTVFCFKNCSVHLKGGTFNVGNDTGFYDPNAKLGLYFRKDNYTATSQAVGTIELYDCYDCEIEHIHSDYCKNPQTILVLNSQEVYIHHCVFKNILYAAIVAHNENKHIVIKYCSFYNMRCPNACYYVSTGTADYCYAITVGLKMVPEGTIVTPTDGFEVAHCYLEESDDCGIDSHGSINNYIHDNRIINCRTSITAYNDRKRTATRPNDWQMINTVIENNYCKSDKPTKYRGRGHRYPHPFVFLGNSTSYNEEDKEIYSINSGYESTMNYIVRNNYFSSPNDIRDYVVVANAGQTNEIIQLTKTHYGLLSTNAGMSNLIVENNIFDGQNKVKHAMNFIRVFNSVIKNNTFKNFMQDNGETEYRFTGADIDVPIVVEGTMVPSTPIMVTYGSVTIEDNKSDTKIGTAGNIIYDFNSNYYNYVISKNNTTFNNYKSQLYNQGDIIIDDVSGKISINKSKGLTTRLNKTSLEYLGYVNNNDGMVYLPTPESGEIDIRKTSNIFQKNQCLIDTDTDKEYYISNNLDKYHIILRDINGNLIPKKDTEYIFKCKMAELVEIGG